jgi:hypothetical protein
VAVRVFGMGVVRVVGGVVIVMRYAVLGDQTGTLD